MIFLINTFENFYNKRHEQSIEENKDDLIGCMSGLKGNSANDIFNFSDYVQNVREN